MSDLEKKHTNRLAHVEYGFARLPIPITKDFFNHGTRSVIRENLSLDRDPAHTVLRRNFKEAAKEGKGAPSSVVSRIAGLLRYD